MGVRLWPRGLRVSALVLGVAWYTACGGSAATDRLPASGGGSNGGSASLTAGTASLGGSANAAGSNAGGTSNASCSPAPLGDWMPTFIPPLPPTPGVCSAEQLATVTRVCVAPATLDRAACDAFSLDLKNTACLSCIFTPTSETRFGAVSVDANDFWQVDVAGCIAVIDGDTTPNGCGAKVRGFEDCLRTACEDSCWVGHTDETLAACESLATSGDCSSYYTDQVCMRAPKYAACDTYTDFSGYFTGVANLFCGVGFGSAAGGASGGTGPAAAGAASD